MDYFVGQLIGGLIITFLISRLLFWILKKWDGGLYRVIFVHIFCLLIFALIGGMGMADGGAFAPIEALKRYALPQFLWLLVDLIRRKDKPVVAPLSQ